MSIPVLVKRFYEEIWNSGCEVVGDILTFDFSFRGSLGISVNGHEGFVDYVRNVRTSLDSYHCQIIDCITENDKAFAKMLFSGIHVAEFRGYSPTRKIVSWNGAALFTFRESLISELWVLGDLKGLDDMLISNAREQAN